MYLQIFFKNLKNRNLSLLRLFFESEIKESKVAANLPINFWKKNYLPRLFNGLQNLTFIGLKNIFSNLNQKMKEEIERGRKKKELKNCV